jgi:hypothetical protein
MKGKRIPWNAEELRWVEAHKTMLRPKAHAAFCTKFDRDVKLGAYASLCKRKGWLTGSDGRFASGSVPANKGKKMPYTRTTHGRNSRRASCRVIPNSLAMSACRKTGMLR